MKVLVVDDDAAGLDIRRLVLERHGFAVATASSVDAARAAFAADRPDVVVLDLRLPEVEDGLGLIREFREVRIVVLCGNPADLDGREEAAMVAGILGKPVRSEELVRWIRGGD
ncbi:MAG: response regulator [Acidobacteriia bacterium]|nr:response regulator [Terriglobia bacterium]